VSSGVAVTAAPGPASSGVATTTSGCASSLRGGASAGAGLWAPAHAERSAAIAIASGTSRAVRPAIGIGYLLARFLASAKLLLATTSVTPVTSAQAR
jgi:hypothetical protein